MWESPCSVLLLYTDGVCSHHRGYEPSGSVLPQPSGVLTADLRRLLEAALLCNNARLLPPTPERPRWAALGDQTEAALRVLALKGGVDERALQRDRPRMHEIPFEAARKRMSTIHGNARGNGGQFEYNQGNRIKKMDKG